ncbi:elongation factor P maturation arginine rhamnosyltransferase EarP [Piscinibacter sp.]|uniref:elongation factor P maturation arginine rhamnosyltransferase EarP n=1 Tax=Piscinibacter sp. TaxID=1903157 RepID=UPI002CE44DEF|nr:elongation factor P maturation arginine rhamnosyltransferase EarP [Albitalea sp.]HUG25850.1 elongation factor P maturation arginine rhamnosyltransferase EarP [Albitalea sp.]
MLWDLFCRVVDNFGDIGVCWRAAADLASRGERVRLWIDDPSALAWMAPSGCAGVAVQPWQDGSAEMQASDVVIEAFGCDPSPGFVARMATAPQPPVWINLEYLSAEDYVERNHALPSPQLSGPGRGLTKWFFYPGFTRSTGGLLREPGLLTRQQHFDATAWLADWGVQTQPGERIVSLFCYDNPSLPALIDTLADRPTLLLATAGAATAQATSLLGPSLRRGALRAVLLPALPQTEFDALLWAADLNFVRGEDSFVRAQWAAKPFVWHIYPQDDGAHAVKMTAFAERFLAGVPAGPAGEMRRLWAAWNGLGGELPPLPALAPWRRHCEDWRDGLLAQPDLITQLMGFVDERR